MHKQSKKILYLFMKILGLAVFNIPILLKSLNIINNMSKPLVITLIIIGTALLFTEDILERRTKKHRTQDKFN